MIMLALLRLVVILLLFFLNLMLLAPLLLGCAACRFLVPMIWVRRQMTVAIEAIYQRWITNNRWLFYNLLPTEWHVEGQDPLPQDSCVMIANHLSWMDVFVLHSVFEGRLPHQKYFMKESLRWMPFAGQVCWALGYIFVKRYTLSQIRKNPGLRQASIDTIDRACRAFHQEPVTVVNFPEGARWTPQRHADLRSVYRHLLPPEGGGIAIVLNALPNIRHIVDVTLSYEAQSISLYEFLCGRIKRIHVQYRVIEVTEPWVGQYFDDRPFRRRFQAKLCEVWQQKDGVLTALKDTRSKGINASTHELSS